MSLHKLRFLNPVLQMRFADSVRRSGLDSTISGERSFECSDEEWQEIISLAHKVRDSCFKWYFSWCDSQEGAQDLENHLRSNGLRFELEDHGDRLVFLLPREDQEKHYLPDDPIDHESCSFCGKSWTEIKRFVTSKTAAICDECIQRFYSDLRDGPPGGRSRAGA